jgi:phage shock protein PspC (stress-responsive transcriptional regulator)
VVERKKNLNELRKSVRDKNIAGICGGFAEYTNTPSWLWRVIFLISLFISGLGLIAYIILWFYMPAGRKQ